MVRKNNGRRASALFSFCLAIFTSALMERRCNYMILFTILSIMLVMLIVTAVAVLAVGGGAFIIVFADLIVCAFVIIWIIKRLIKRRK